MPVRPDQPADTDAEQADLERLSAELALLSYRAQLVTPPGRLPYLHVRNPRNAHLTENVYAQAGSYFWPWAEPIAGCHQAAEAAAVVARVLRTVDDR